MAKPQGLEEKDFDPQLFAMLKDLRYKIAKKEGVPQYIVFTNKLLEALTKYAPSSVEEGLAIPGIGEGKAQTLSTAVPGNDSHLSGDELISPRGD